MALFESAQSNHQNTSRGLKQICGYSRLAFLGFAAIMATGCGTTGRGHRQCRSHTVHAARCQSSATSSPPAYRSDMQPQQSQPNQAPQYEQELLGGYGLAPSESAPIELPVEVAPVPQQWAQPIEESNNTPPVHQELDPMDLELERTAEPIEI